MFLFLLQFVMKFIDQLVGKGLTAWVIIELIALNLAWMLVLAVPMSVLVATLMAFGDLSSRNEITAMKASGVSIYRMMLTPVLIAGLRRGAPPGVVQQLRPARSPTTGSRRSRSDIRRKKPTIIARRRRLLAGHPRLQHPRPEDVRARPTTSKGSRSTTTPTPAMNVVITAERGEISFSPDYRKLIMDLQEGEIHELDLQKMTGYRRIRFETHRIAMDVEGFDFERAPPESPFSGATAS